MKETVQLCDKVYNSLLMRYYKVECGDDFVCIGRLIIQGHGVYKFGKHLTIYSKETVNPIGGNKTVFQTINGGRIVLGDYVGMSHAILSSRREICIEDYVLIGAGVKIFDHDFHSLSYEQRMKKEDRYVKSEPVLIKEGTFVGTQAMILKGVTLGKRSIIGAGSVVTKDIPDGEVWAGNPAKFIGKVS